MILAGYIEWKIFKTSAKKSRRVKREFPPQDDHWLVGKPTRFPVAKQKNYKIGEMFEAANSSLEDFWNFPPKTSSAIFNKAWIYLFFFGVFLRILPRKSLLNYHLETSRPSKSTRKKPPCEYSQPKQVWIPVGCFQK